VAININCAVIKRLAENPLQEKIAVLYVMMYTSASLLGGLGITETCLKFADENRWSLWLGKT
jgi:hypothetical protein